MRLPQFPSGFNAAVGYNPAGLVLATGGPRMIEFNCVCKQYKFSLPPEMAGSLIQCPTCRRLVDVPTLEELVHIDDDGGYKFEGESQPKKLDTKLATRAFTAQHIDEFGEEIDLRNSFEEIQRVGIPHAPGTLDGVKPIPPKYDPVTGELIRALPIKNDTPQRVLPVEPENDEPLDAVPIPPPKLSYSVIPEANMPLGSVFIALLQPVNLVVMGFILLLHFLAQVTSVIVLTGFIFVFIVPLLLGMALIGHYGNVIEEIGPGGRDELPTPLRNASFGEDIWWPFVRIDVALFLSYLPAWISLDVPMPLGMRHGVDIICLVFGTLVAPAMILTSVTSGTYQNLRPDRVAGVISICGARYFLPCLTFTAAMALYGFGFQTLDLGSATLMHLKGFSVGLTEMASGYAVLAAAIYLTHAVCWQLGLIYRTYHDRFPWTMQRHISVRKVQGARPHPGQLPPMKAR
jgi:hypothetical protein